MGSYLIEIVMKHQAMSRKDPHNYMSAGAINIAQKEDFFTFSLASHTQLCGSGLKGLNNILCVLRMVVKVYC